MAIVKLARDHQEVLMALAADDLSTYTGYNNGDRCIISDGPDKIFVNGSWVDDASDEGTSDEVLTIYLASAARTALVNGADFSTRGYKYLEVEIDITAVTATPAVTFTVQGKTLSDVYYTVLASAALAAISVVRLTIGPGLPVTANISANTVLPETMRIAVSVGDTDSATYSVRTRLSN
jgi:hypothetical protein